MPAYDFTYAFPGFPTVLGRDNKGTTTGDFSDGALSPHATQHTHHHHVQAAKDGEGKVGKRRRPSRRKDPTNPESLVRRMVANTQERNRMHGLNDALDRLRRHIPLHLGPRRLSKIKTLRLAMAYIEALTDMVHGSPPSLSYPDSGDSCHVKTEESNATDEAATGKGAQRFSGQTAISGKNFFGKSKERGKGRMRGHVKGAGRAGPQVTRPSGYSTDMQRGDDRMASFGLTS